LSWFRKKENSLSEKQRDSLAKDIGIPHVLGDLRNDEIYVKPVILEHLTTAPERQSARAERPHSEICGPSQRDDNDRKPSRKRKGQSATECESDL
jgi:hypothetical protein